MIRSMTGFGGASAETDGAHFSIEIRSVNNKYVKVVVRLPEELVELEGEVEAQIARRITRGSVVATVRYVDHSADAASEINAQAVERYIEQLRAIKGVPVMHLDLSAIVALPGVVVPASTEQRLERARKVLLPLADEACDRVIAMRVREGEQLHEELLRHARSIREHLEVISHRVPEIVQLYQERLHQRINGLLAETGLASREEDVLREVAIFSERSDIAEEVSRLSGHLDQFEEIVTRDREEPAGRTLDFLSQEMLREANTIGSKCLDVEIARRIVEIKGAIDRIKEQAQNCE
jgi:uncharacterized protein (TIGR00255 family)